MHDLIYRVAHALYESAVAAGLEARFEWAEVCHDYHKFARAFLARAFPLSGAADAQRPNLPHQPPLYPRPDCG